MIINQLQHRGPSQFMEFLITELFEKTIFAVEFLLIDNSKKKSNMEIRLISTECKAWETRVDYYGVFS